QLRSPDARAGSPGSALLEGARGRHANADIAEDRPERQPDRGLQPQHRRPEPPPRGASQPLAASAGPPPATQAAGTAILDGATRRSLWSAPRQDEARPSHTRAADPAAAPLHAATRGSRQAPPLSPSPPHGVLDLPQSRVCWPLTRTPGRRSRPTTAQPRGRV